MIEHRRVRFASIEGLKRSDLALAAEIWLQDVYSAPWATRETMRFAAHFVRYMAAPDVRMMTVGTIEQVLQLSRDETEFGLRALHLYRAVEAYTLAKGEVKVALNLSIMQRLRVLDARGRLERHAEMLPAQTAFAADRWIPTPSEPADDIERVAGEPADQPTPPGGIAA